MSKTTLFSTRKLHTSAAKHGALYSSLQLALPSLIYMAIYLTWWSYIERTPQVHYTVIHMVVDDYIPFLEIFIIPYALWFLYVAVPLLYFIFTRQKADYYRLITFLFTGMTIFLIVSTLFPNILHLRPDTISRNNIFSQMVAMLYRADTPTCVWPSIHVYNSIGIHLSIANSSRFARHKWIRTSSLILCVSIILSTMFLKQHSVFDVVTAFVMAIIMNTLVYHREWVARFLRIFRRRVEPAE